MKESNLTHNSNWRTEMMLLVKQINTSLNDDKSMDLLKDAIKDLDLKRNKKITNYIPDIYEYI